MARHSLLVVAGFLVAIAAFAKPAWAKVFQFDESREYAVEDGFKLTVSNTAGDVVVAKGTSDKLKLRIIKEIDESSREKAEELEDMLEVEIDAAVDRVDIAARYPERNGARGFLEELFSLGRGFPGVVHFEIETPQSVDLQVSTTSGNIDLSGLAGTIQVDATSGEVLLTSVDAACDIDVTSGDVNLKEVKGDVDIMATSSNIMLENITGDITMQATSGDAELLWVNGAVRITKTSGNVHAEKCSGDFSIKSTSGDVTLDQREGGLTISTTSGNVEVTSDFRNGKRFDIETISGDIRVLAPAEIKGDLILETLSGSIDTDLALEVRSLNRQKIEGRIGGGGVGIELRSTSGDIVLKEY